MYCDMDTSTLTAYVDHQLTDDERERVTVHLQSCNDCREKLAELQNVTDDLERYFYTINAPSGLEEAVMQRLYASRNTKQISRLNALCLVSAGIGVAVVLAFMLSPLGSIMGVIFHILFVLLHGLSLLPISLDYGWFFVIALSSIGFAAASFLGLRRLLRTLNSEVVI